MRLHQIGLDIRHMGGLQIDRPFGSGDNLFLVFKTGAVLNVSGRRIRMFPDSCILFGKGIAQNYGSMEQTYVDHFVHFEGNEEQLSRIGIPLNTPFSLNNLEEIEKLLKEISRLQSRPVRNREEEIECMLILLLLKISDGCGPIRTQKKRGKNSTESLIRLRADIYSSPARYHSVRDMAEELNLSVSRFQCLYTRQFGISSYDDLLTSRVMHAQQALTETGSPVKQIAAQVGYDNEVCFMRCFRKKTGYTPTEFRLRAQQTAEKPPD